MVRTKTTIAKPLYTPLLESKATSNVAKTFGDAAIVGGQYFIDNPKSVLPISPALDFALGGGFQVGSLVTLAGLFRTGKTSTAIHAAVKWQAMGKRVVYVDAEKRLEERNLKAVGLNIDPSMFITIGSYRGKILSAEDIFSIVYTYLCEETDLLVIIDSISILSENREIIGGMGTETRGGSAKLLAQFCRLAAPVIPVNDHIVIGIAHLYANTGGGYKKYYVSMGNKGQYALQTALYAEYAEPWTVGSDDKKVTLGQINHWKVERSPIGPPNEKARSYLRYNHGIDEVQEIIQFATDFKFIERAGTWYSYDMEGQTIKGQGEEKFRQALSNHDGALTHMTGKVREILVT